VKGKPTVAGKQNRVCVRWLTAALAGCAAVLLLMQACALKSTPAPSPPADHPRPYNVNGTWYQPIPHAHGFSETGIASWYGKKFHGRKTANGEIYDMYAMTAAHKTLPLGTWVNVRNLQTGKAVVVRVNDRGPFIQGRVIDLSLSAAQRLEIVGPGTAQVQVIALGQRRHTAAGEAFVPVDYRKGAFTFQVGAFSSRVNAEKLRAKLESTFTNAHIKPYDRGDAIFYRVRVGRCSDLESAAAYGRQLASNGYPGAFIVAE
jgi:rare lipoprotein A